MLIEFEIYNRKYKIIRGIKPTIFVIYQNDILLDQDAASRDYQEYLEKNILRMHMKSFSQIVILGSSSFVPFMQLPAGIRREVIEDLLDIRIFSTMSVLLKDRISSNKDEILTNKNEIQNSVDILELHEKQKKKNCSKITTTPSLNISKRIQKMPRRSWMLGSTPSYLEPSPHKMQHSCR